MLPLTLNQLTAMLLDDDLVSPVEGGEVVAALRPLVEVPLAGLPLGLAGQTVGPLQRPLPHPVLLSRGLLLPPLVTSCLSS